MAASGYAPNAVGSHATAILECAVEQIKAKLVHARRTDACARFEAGDQIHLIRTSPELRRGAMRQLAVRLGLHESGLQRMGRTSERIRGAERQQLLGLVDSRGFPLCWSVFEALEGVSGADTRLAFASRVLSEDLAIRELRGRLAIVLCQAPNAPSIHGLANCEPSRSLDRAHL